MEKKRNLFKKATLGAILIASLLSPITTSATSLTKDLKFLQYPTKIEYMEDSLVNYIITMYNKDGTQTRLDKKFNYGIKVVNQRTAIAVKDAIDNINGLELIWDQVNNTANAKGRGKELIYPLNKRVMSNNGRIVELDTSATVDAKVSRTYLPLRSMMESLDYDVKYNQEAKTIDIIEKGATVSKPTKPVDKPIVKPSTQGPKATYTESKVDHSVKELGLVDEYAFNKRTFEKPDLTKMPKIEKVNGTYFPKDKRFGYKNVIEYSGADRMVMYDGTSYYSDFDIKVLSVSPYTEKSGVDSVMIDGARILTGNNTVEYGLQAVKDDKGNIYTSNRSNIQVPGKNTSLLGSKITTLYLMDHLSGNMIKIDLQKPFTIPKEGGMYNVK